MIIITHRKIVRSDKKLDRVIDSRINFADGSWCDVATGESVNKGPGYITICDVDGNVISSQCMSAGGGCSQVAIGRNVVQQSGGVNIIIGREVRWITKK